MALEVATYNINAWSSFKDKLGELPCHVILLQEHRLLGAAAVREQLRCTGLFVRVNV